MVRFSPNPGHSFVLHEPTHFRWRYSIRSTLVVTRGPKNICIVHASPGPLWVGSLLSARDIEADKTSRRIRCGS